MEENNQEYSEAEMEKFIQLLGDSGLLSSTKGAKLILYIALTTIAILLVLISFLLSILTGVFKDKADEIKTEVKTQTSEIMRRNEEYDDRLNRNDLKNKDQDFLISDNAKEIERLQNKRP